MRITWRDGITTAAVAGAIVIERAFFHYDWAIVESMRWTIGILAALTAVGLFFSYVLDTAHSTLWTLAASVFALSTAVLTGLGLYYVNSDYVVLLMLNAVLFWMVSIGRHLTISAPASHSPV